MNDPRVTVIIVNYRTPDLTFNCVTGILAERKSLPDLRVVVVDGGSSDGSASQLKDRLSAPDFREWVSFLPLPINGGFGWANNQAILTIAGSDNPPEFIHFLNPDASIHPDAIHALIRELRAQPDAGCVGSQLVDTVGNDVPSAFRFPSAGRELISAAQSTRLGKLLGISSAVVGVSESVDVDWVTGASFMVRTSALKESGLFDDGFFLYFEEVELMHRLHRCGWTVRHVPTSRVVHAEGSSTGIQRRASLPDYWYNSRRRYFALTGGPAAVMRANLACLAGLTARTVKMPLRKSLTAPAVSAADLLRFRFWPRRTDAIASAPAWKDDPGKEPFWMSIQ
ncbi:MAG TPA: glycosyltransferase family 2 protein [Sphingomicrobium sp.]|nr:glycosyltransferase family 2 protein [Sphingomicrobium sp.]